MSALKGWFGEITTRLGLWIHLNRETYLRFHNVIVPAENGTTQIDHLILSPYGIFVIETKNMRGWIFGSERQTKWTQSIYGRKYSFQNPLHQNLRHTKCLASHLGMDEKILHSVVFFIGDCSFKTIMPQNVMRSGLSSFIRSHAQVLIDQNEIERIRDQILDLKNQPALTNRLHVRSLQQRHASRTVCPKCGASLVERVAKKGHNPGSKFLGCSAYPRCRFTRAT